MKTFVSDVSGKEFEWNDLVNAHSVRKSILELITKDHPNFDEHSQLSVEELNFYRQKYISEKLVEEVGELNELKKQVLHSIKKSELITTTNDATKKDTLGNRIAG